MLIVITVYVAVSVVTLVLFGLDKRAARRAPQSNRRPTRVPESTLHFLELLGGFPGTLLAQRIFRHKTRKTKYLITLWLIIALHAAFWIWWNFGRDDGPRHFRDDVAN